MRHGLWISSDNMPLLHDQVTALLAGQDIPLAGFTEASSTLFAGCEDRISFLFRASEAIFCGECIPAALILRHLSSDAMPGNVIRRYLEWQDNLLPYLADVEVPVQGDGFFYLGDALLVCPLSLEGAVDARLPSGQWTDIITGEVVTGRFRRLRSPNAMPILAAQGAVLPTGSAACPTLHWYQPPEGALGLMHPEPYHLILHRDGEETCLR